MITLATLSQATAQEVFDQVAKHLLEQNKQSANTHNCLYRCEIEGETLKCAAGCLIADEEYSPKMENNGWIMLTQMNMVPSSHYALIRNLQDIHDNYSINRWKNELENLAQKEGLQFNFNQNQ